VVSAQAAVRTARCTPFESVEEQQDVPAITRYVRYAPGRPSGNVAITGGFQAENRNIEVMSSFPGIPDGRWNVRARNVDTSDRTLTVFASCIVAN
jgi:hypothetical protein